MVNNGRKGIKAMTEYMLRINIFHKFYKRNKGFTLVELIVILVILAILAAILVPALLGYINKTKQSNAIEECHMCVVAAQSIATDEYGKNNTFIKSAGANQILEITDLSDSKGKISSVDYIANSTQVSKLVYTAANGFMVTYTYTVGDKSGKYTFTQNTDTGTYQKENLSGEDASKTAVLNNLRAINSDIEDALGSDWSTTFNDQRFDIVSGGKNVKLLRKDGSYKTIDFSGYYNEFVKLYGVTTKFTVELKNGKLNFTIRGKCNNGIAGNAASTTVAITFTVDGNITGIDKITSFSAE